MHLKKDDFEEIIQNLYDGLYIVDLDRIIQYWNKAAEQISGFSGKEVIGSSCSDNILVHIDRDGHNLCRGKCPLAATLADGKTREADVYLHHKNGHRLPVSVRISPIKDSNGSITGAVELFTDISHRTNHEFMIEELEKLALLDNLTRLANRNYIEREIQNRIEEKKRFNISFGILFIDIDNFKQFNDTYGHSVGDKVLQFVARTFRSNARPFDLYGRWGGEEFIGIIRNVDNTELKNIGNRIRILTENAYILHEDNELRVTISLGASLVKKQDTMESLLKRADSLLYKSKAAGKNCLTAG